MDQLVPLEWFKHFPKFYLGQGVGFLRSALYIFCYYFREGVAQRTQVKPAFSAKSFYVGDRFSRKAMQGMCARTLVDVADDLANNEPFPNLAVNVLPRRIFVNETAQEISDFDVSKVCWNNSQK